MTYHAIVCWVLFLKGRYDSLRDIISCVGLQPGSNSVIETKPGGNIHVLMIVGVEGWGLASPNHGAAGNSWPKADIAVRRTNKFFTKN